MKNIIYLLAILFLCYNLTNCSKIYVKTNHENPYSNILEDLKINNFDSTNSKIEIRLWIYGEFGLIEFYKYNLLKNSTASIDKYIPRQFCRTNMHLATNSFYKKNANKIFWIRKKRILNYKVNFKLQKILTVINFSNTDSSTFKDFIIGSNTTYKIEIINKEKNNSYLITNPNEEVLELIYTIKNTF